jgi:hypothetical protein
MTDLLKISSESKLETVREETLCEGQMSQEMDKRREEMFKRLADRRHSDF